MDFKKILPPLITAIALITAQVSVLVLGRDNIVEKVATVVAAQVGVCSLP